MPTIASFFTAIISSKITCNDSIRNFAEEPCGLVAVVVIHEVVRVLRQNQTIVAVGRKAAPVGVDWFVFVLHELEYSLVAVVCRTNEDIWVLVVVHQERSDEISQEVHLCLIVHLGQVTPVHSAHKLA